MLRKKYDVRVDVSADERVFRDESRDVDKVKVP
jgi:hypothetical protein